MTTNALHSLFLYKFWMKPPLNAVESHRTPWIAKRRQGAPLSVGKRSEPATRRDWAPWSAASCHQTVLDCIKTMLGRRKTAVGRSGASAKAACCSSTAYVVYAALYGASWRCQYAHLQLRTIDDDWPRSMTDTLEIGARRRKFWTVQNFRRATAATGASWRSPAVLLALCGAHSRSAAVWEPPSSADENRQCVIVALDP